LTNGAEETDGERHCREPRPSKLRGENLATWALIEQRSREEWQWLKAESIAGRCAICAASTDQISGFHGDRSGDARAWGIAVNSTMFSLVSAFLLPHLPGRDPQNIVVVVVGQSGPDSPGSR